LVVLVAAARDGHALVQVAGDDLPRRAIDLRDAPLSAEADQDSAEQRQPHREPEAPHRRTPKNGVDLVELADVAPDEQPEPGPDPEHERAHGRVVPGAVAAQEVDPLAAAIEFARPIRDVARD